MTDPAAPRLGLYAIPVLGIMTGTAALSLDMYLPAFPAIAADYGVAEGGVQVTMSTFLLGFAMGQALYGPLSDALGRRRVILVALAFYGVISALCAVSATIGDLALWRGLQGLAGAAGSVLGRAVIRDVYEGPRLLKAMSMLMLVLTAAPMAAPLIGSVVLELWGWRSVFWTLAAYAMAWSVLMLAMIPETLPPERRRSLRPGAVGRVFAEVLSHRRAMGYTLTAALGFAGMFAYIAATPFIYMSHFGVSPGGYALFFAANVGGMALSSFVNGRLVGRMSGDSLLTLFTGILLVAAAALVAGALTGLGGVWGLAVPLFFYVGSLSAIAANAISGTLQAFGHAAGTASSVFGLFQFGLGSVAGAVMAGIGDGSPAPMAWVILGCAVLSVAALHGLARAR
ncbi:Bcr/CflA family multidrug efflux MFS transporter [Roseospira navarrensis]|uniref:Bcr/CflA family efflux transporter n=1 Tax=Roseospira navarrensis TaxID=140058 RepID=A0A7X1ZC27_9PROT|nr:Bcr/CflA family multidrug efflux MFS transporter [Roseospira navarrensis]MQX35592.1 Bcr/CflA family multidrug efflux MFS transporter [Roseospira navarrensis]